MRSPVHVVHLLAVTLCDFWLMASFIFQTGRQHIFQFRENFSHALTKRFEIFVRTSASSPSRTIDANEVKFKLLND